MPSIALLTAHAKFPWFRQIRGGGDCVGDWRFTLDEIAEDCAFLVVYDEIAAPVETTLPRARRMVILSEPPGIKTYKPGYLEQFGHIYGPELEHVAQKWIPVLRNNMRPNEDLAPSPNAIVTQPALPWFYGVGFTPRGLVANESVDTLLAMPPPPKQQAVSLVISKKSQLPKHRARLAFVEKLAARLGDKVKVFGRGFTEVSDKAEAILPYAYHLVLENNDIPHFWTEKTADALLGWSLPLFSGCANLGEYFPEDSFIPVAISDPSRAIAAIEQILAQAPYESRLPAISDARHRVLTRYNLFNILAEFADGLAAKGGAMRGEGTLIRPNTSFSTLTALRSTLRKTRRSLTGFFSAKETP